MLSPVHTSNNVETTGNIVKATFDFVEATFDFVATNGNNVERVYRKISSFRQSRNKLNMFNLFRLCRKHEISFDIGFGNSVAKNGDNVAGKDRALRNESEAIKTTHKTNADVSPAPAAGRERWSPVWRTCVACTLRRDERR